MKCLRCGPLIKAIDAYLAKAEIAAMCELLDIQQDEIGKFFFPEMSREDESA